MQHKLILYRFIATLNSPLARWSSQGVESSGARPSMDHETTGARSCLDTAARSGACQSCAVGADPPGPWSNAEPPHFLCTTANVVHTLGVGAPSPPLATTLAVSSGTIDLDVEISRSKLPGRLRLLGQVTTGEPSLTQVKVTIEGPSGHLQRETDDLGQFMFERLLAGDHQLTVTLVS